MSVPNTSKLRSLKLKKDKDGRYYLRAVYDQEDSYRKTELIIPKIMLPISNYPVIKEESGEWYRLPQSTANIGFGDMQLGKGVSYPDAPECCYTIKTIEEKTRTMTLSEIEKKLGYRINLVAEKEVE